MTINGYHQVHCQFWLVAKNQDTTLEQIWEKWNYLVRCSAVLLHNDNLTRIILNNFAENLESE